MLQVATGLYFRDVDLHETNHRRVLFTNAWFPGGQDIELPGIGRLLVFAIQNRDVPLLQAISLVVAGVYAVANLGADVAQRLLDPRTSLA